MPGKDYGGACTLRLSNGTFFRLRGETSHMTAGQENEAVTNQDRSVDRVVTLQAFKAEISFADDGLAYDQMMASDRFDASFVEDATGTSHIYSRCFVEGTPAINRTNGEVSGCTIVAEEYYRQNA